MTEHIWEPGQIFVFGSNLAGIHGAGAAKFAVENCGAVRGRGIGRYGQSYALPTKDEKLGTLPLAKIETHVQDFLADASMTTNAVYFVTAIGTGLAGCRHEDIAPMFRFAPSNCILPPEWIELLKVAKKRGAR